MKNIMEMPIIRLNGSSYINDMELKERYKVYNDSCWISLLSLVGNPDGAIVTVDEPVSPLLTMDLEKRLKTALEEDPADFLDRKSTRLNSSHRSLSRMPSSA